MRLLPGCTRLTLRYDTLALWHALDADQPPPPAYRLAEDMPVLIWRRDLQPHFRSLSVAEALAIDRTLAADTFADTCAALAALGPEIDPTHCAGACLRQQGFNIGEAARAKKRRQSRFDEIVAICIQQDAGAL